MHIAYSAFQNTNKTLPGDADNHLSARYRGYRAACRKHQQTIKEIQQYLPGWEPPLPVGSMQLTVSSQQF